MSTEPGRIATWTWPSSSTATTRTAAWAQAVAGQEHGARADSGRIAGVGKRGPAQPVVVLGVEIGYELEVVFHRFIPLPGVIFHGTGLATGDDRSPGPVKPILNVMRTRGRPSHRSVTITGNMSTCRGSGEAGSSSSPSSATTPHATFTCTGTVNSS